MRDGLADGLARVRERVSTLRGRGESTPRDRYVLLPAGSGRRRRLAEIGAATGAVVVVLAFVGATVALRPTSSPQPDTPGLPAPTEAVHTPTGSSSSASPSATAVPTDPPTGAAPQRTTRYTPSATATASPTTPAPSSKASTPAPPRTTAPRTTPPPSATVSPSPSPSPTPTPTTEPPAPGVAIHPFG